MRQVLCGDYTCVAKGNAQGAAGQSCRFTYRSIAAYLDRKSGFRADSPVLDLPSGPEDGIYADASRSKLSAENDRFRHGLGYERLEGQVVSGKKRARPSPV